MPLPVPLSPPPK